MRRTLRFIFDRALYALVYPLALRSARKVLQPEIDRPAVSDHLRQVRRIYLEETATLPPHPTVGARLMTRLAALTVAQYRALRERGLDATIARERTAKLNWSVYQTLTGPTWAWTRLLGRDRLKRVKRAMDFYMRFPYAKPGYIMDWVIHKENTIGFDVQRCPAADYFKSRDLAELCTDAFCDLDFPLAEVWGVELQRKETIAKGCEQCTFRFHRKDLSSGD